MPSQLLSQPSHRLLAQTLSSGSELMVSSASLNVLQQRLMRAANMVGMGNHMQTLVDTTPVCIQEIEEDNDSVLDNVAPNSMTVEGEIAQCHGPPAKVDEERHPDRVDGNNDCSVITEELHASQAPSASTTLSTGHNDTK
jgi:hypothetical protein